MHNPQTIQIANYHYNLPENRIAKYPLAERDSSQLLIYKDRQIEASVFKQLPEKLTKDSLLVFNTTKVIRARLQFRKSTGAIIEIFCLEPYTPSNHALALHSQKSCQWKCFIGNLKRWKEPELQNSIEINGENCVLSAYIVERAEDAFIIQFKWNKPLTFSEILQYSGAIPIPPYLNRASESTDNQRYQTVFSQVEGSVAAPTAGLHFTPKILAKLTTEGIETAELTLHVGAGTFKPVKSKTVGAHHMHTEVFSFSMSLLKVLLKKEQIVAVGTTGVRSLESIYQIGVKLLLGCAEPLHILQWEAYELPDYTKEEAINAVIMYMKRENLESITAKTSILIAPGYEFKIVSAMLTNFHQPQSTLLLLVSAFVGDTWRTIYDYALANDFRFLSYGDSSLLFKG